VAATEIGHFDVNQLVEKGISPAASRPGEIFGLHRGQATGLVEKGNAHDSVPLAGIVTSGDLEKSLPWEFSKRRPKASFPGAFIFKRLRARKWRHVPMPHGHLECLKVPFSSGSADLFRAGLWCRGERREPAADYGRPGRPAPDRQAQQERLAPTVPPRSGTQVLDSAFP
jgi:hypothetical protein